MCTRPRQYSLGNEEYAIESSILHDGSGYLRVCNLGTDEVNWKKDSIVARAERCDAVMSSEVSILPINCESLGMEESIGGVKFSDLDVGGLDDKNRQELFTLLKSHSDCFASSTKEIGCTNLGEMQIHLTSDKPIHRRPYRLAHSVREVVSNKIKDLLDGNIIRESTSDYASPIILVRKKNGDYRLCVDYRDLNAITVKERFPLPHIEDQVARLSGT